ncbi:Gti1/Pac2 family-domain-containing protein [Mycena albidolilacea]|uniref:Gti1/Pac2 family-domain-containing protein n=1 Tax=Mycena albidolilacea TaxID=1033008 RepID=A0AAD7ADA7_9AGAR|nr:Gti1/Pac2 family-domain-containing protein [Mycena albidolilacea]
MQSATCGNLRIRSPSDVRIVFHAVLLNILPMVTRRLDSEERGLIAPGSVYVWEERGAHTEITGVGIERWTDGIRWGPSRVREGFLFYHEKPSSHYVFPGGIYPSHRQQAPQELLIKQTYTAFVDTPRGQRKWHLIAYFTEESVDRLNCIDDYPDLSSLHVPHGKYKSARSVKGRPDHIFNPDDSTDSGEFSHLQYVAYDPGSVSSRSSRSTPSPRYTSRSLTWNGPPGDADARRQMEHKRGRSLPEMESGGLAPLEYLQTVTPPRRHPVDETALKLFRAP